MQEIAVFDIGTIVFLEEVRTVLSGSIGDLERTLTQAIIIKSLNKYLSIPI
jgi:hypothetical protein